VIEYLSQVHREPELIRSDNGSRVHGERGKEVAPEAGMKTAFIDPGSPWEST
jgi:hypothetical protein